MLTADWYGLWMQHERDSGKTQPEWYSSCMHWSQQPSKGRTCAWRTPLIAMRGRNLNVKGLVDLRVGLCFRWMTGFNDSFKVIHLLIIHPTRPFNKTPSITSMLDSRSCASGRKASKKCISFLLNKNGSFFQNNYNNEKLSSIPITSLQITLVTRTIHHQWVPTKTSKKISKLLESFCRKWNIHKAVCTNKSNRFLGAVLGLHHQILTKSVLSKNFTLLGSLKPLTVQIE